MEQMELPGVEKELFYRAFVRVNSSDSLPFEFDNPQVFAAWKRLEEKGLVHLRFHEDGSLATVTLAQKGYSML